MPRDPKNGQTPASSTADELSRFLLAPVREGKTKPVLRNGSVVSARRPKPKTKA